MNHCVTGWHYFSNPRMFPEYGKQKAGSGENPAADTSNGAEKSWRIVEVTDRWSFLSGKSHPVADFCCTPVSRAGCRGKAP